MVIGVGKVTKSDIHEAAQVAEEIGEGHTRVFDGIDDEGGKVDEVIFTGELLGGGVSPGLKGIVGVLVQGGLLSKKHELGLGFLPIFA